MDKYCDCEVGEEEEGVAEVEEAGEVVAEEKGEMEDNEENHEILQTSSHLQFFRGNAITMRERKKIVNHKFLLPHPPPFHITVTVF